MNINNVLHKSVKDLKDRGYTEDQAWLESYIKLVNKGILAHPYISVKEDDLNADYFYIFAHSTSSNQDFTYISAKYKNSDIPISIDLYDKFYDYIVTDINKDVKDEELRQDMLDGLSASFNSICEDYVRQLDSELTIRLLRKNINNESRYRYKESMLNGIINLFKNNEIKHITLNVDKKNDSIVRGIFKANNLSIDGVTITMDIDRDTGNAFITTTY